jgi:hypothetical protein
MACLEKTTIIITVAGVSSKNRTSNLLNATWTMFPLFRYAWGEETFAIFVRDFRNIIIESTQRIKWAHITRVLPVNIVTKDLIVIVKK